VEQIQYASANDGAVYSQAATYPDGTNVSVGRASYPGTKLVKTVRRASGRGNMLDTQYKYYRLAQDKGGRGALGFARVDSTDVQTGIVTSRWPYQVFPHIGAEHYTHVRTLTGTLLTDSSETRAEAKLALGAPVSTAYSYVLDVTVAKKDLNSADLGRTVTTNSLLDEFGNIRQSTTLTTSAANSSGWSVSKAMTFDNDTLNWRLAEVRSVTESRTNNAGSLARSMSYTYDGKGLLATETREGDATAKLQTSYARNAFGAVTLTTLNWMGSDGTGKTRTVTDVGWTANGRFQRTIKNAAGHIETRTYDARSGAPASVTTANGLAMSWTSDGFGRTLSAVAIDGTETLTTLKTCSTYCPPGASTVVIHESKRGTETVAAPVLQFADSSGHIVRKLTWGFDGTKIVADTIYDSRDRAVDTYWPRFVGGEGWSEPLGGAGAVRSRHVDYDDLDRSVQVTTFNELGNGQSSTSTYNGFNVTMRNAKGQEKTDRKDVWGRLESSTDANSKITKFKHDAFGNLVETIDAAGNAIAVKFDAWGRRTELKDPDLGTTTYSVDALGQVWRQISAKQAGAGKATTMEFDDLGRLVKRVADDGVSSHVGRWTYDTPSSTVSCASIKSCGQLVEAATLKADGSKDFRREHTYDELGRPSLVITFVGNTSNTSKTEYDTWGRPVRSRHKRDGGTEKVFEQRYNTFGHLARIDRGGQALWTAVSYDASMRLLSATLGNGIKVARSYNQYTGHLSSGNVALSENVLLQEGYAYDVLGNVEQRTQSWPGQSFIEMFEYDALNRLTKSTLGGTTQVFTYDDIGNIRAKTNVGGNSQYAYQAPGPNGIGYRPHAVSAIPNVGSFQYDANGNMTEGAGRTITWMPFDMPKRISQGAESSTFLYGPGYERIQQTRADGTEIYYAGAMEVEVRGASTKVKTYWPLQLGFEVEEGATISQYYTHLDRLGSVVGISDDKGALVERLAYDSWGKRRNLTNADTPGSIDGEKDNKGFTGHEMLDRLDLVHMNGRVYDPLVARFLSADPVIQDPEHTQSYNRYSYVWNNPTNLTDPTGFMAMSLSSFADKNGNCDKRCQQIEDDLARERSRGNPYVNSPSRDTSGGAGVTNKVAEKGSAIKPSGTFFFGGAGMRGDYVPDMVSALGEAGIKDVSSVNPTGYSLGDYADAGPGVAAARGDFPAYTDYAIGLWGKHASRLDFKGNGDGQFNLIGYSYGSLMAAVEATAHTRQGNRVDNLVLVGSPISKDFLDQLQKNPLISKVHVVDLTRRGDPIYAGMPLGTLVWNINTLMKQQQTYNTGHFYYAPSGSEGNARRRDLAKQLFEAGLR
jgi:RHS repeat-associated protein